MGEWPKTGCVLCGQNCGLEILVENDLMVKVRPDKENGKDAEKMSEVYEKLREHLDNLPGGFPAAENGVELRILKRLFTPEEAEIAPFLGMKKEELYVPLGYHHMPVS